MAVITLSTALGLARMSWSQQRRDLAFDSIFGSQAVEVSGPRWMVSLAAPLMKEADAGAWQALLLRLAGKTNQLEVWNQMRAAPLGTMRGTMTLSGNHAQGAAALIITAGAGQAGTTLNAGDLLGLGSGITQQVVMVLDDATANGSGVITVNINPALRGAFSSGAAITWDQPKALFRATSSRVDWEYAAGKIVKIGGLDLVEDWRS